MPEILEQFRERVQEGSTPSVAPADVWAWKWLPTCRPGTLGPPTRFRAGRRCRRHLGLGRMEEERVRGPERRRKVSSAAWRPP